MHIWLDSDYWLQQTWKDPNNDPMVKFTKFTELAIFRYYQRFPAEFTDIIVFWLNSTIILSKAWYSNFSRGQYLSISSFLLLLIGMHTKYCFALISFNVNSFFFGWIPFVSDLTKKILSFHHCSLNVVNVFCFAQHCLKSMLNLFTIRY